jgi:acyl-CoA thioesterase
MLIDHILSSVEKQDHIVIPEGWGQGRALYGGLVGALLVKKAQQLLGEQHKVLRSAFINFVGPVSVGEAQLQAEVLREGKSVTGIQVRLVQNQQVQSVLVASFGSPRESMIQVPSNVTAPSFATPEQGTPFSYLSGISPEFIQHYDAVWSEGAFPFSASEQPDFGGWMRFKAAQQISQLELPHLFALVDMWPPAVLSMYNRIAPASSLTWTLDLIQWPSDVSGQDWWQYQVKTDYAADGYAHTQAHIWDKQGQLVAISRQTVTTFI